MNRQPLSLEGLVIVPVEEVPLMGQGEVIGRDTRCIVVKVPDVVAREFGVRRVCTIFVNSSVCATLPRASL